MSFLPPGHPPIPTPKTGLLLINLGTPEATDFFSVRTYLKEFLSDRRVIEINPLIWWPILNGIILNVRPKKSGHAYEKIWNRELNESPLKTYTREQALKLTAALGKKDQLIVDWAMRYGKPAIADKIRALKQQGCERIVLFPLYPQYSAATTATALDKAYQELQSMRWQPAIRTVPPYYDHPAYIDAVAVSLEQAMKDLPWKPDRVLIAFHGLPREYLNRGDPYHCHCQKTARLVREKLKLSKDFLQVVFQSRFGKAEWLKPYAQDTVEGLPAEGVKNLLMISPGFASDCVETLEELAIGLKETFTENGGDNFAVVPCLNDSTASIAMLAEIASNELKGWLR
ncbi:ferrochelatase [Aestuariivirga litoralis]|uniref:ferrochelatase n=1 Tax=Aestuariivirga litoralis TaxID=2650924 RepID=UPI0018C7490F|nr:ferrochelatase [Aestuariivirga litoralis]MBG1233143.1 ferrochelatase [Aestuariivirga litoralis]